jgi:thioredoxin 2
MGRGLEAVKRVFFGINHDASGAVSARARVCASDGFEEAAVIPPSHGTGADLACLLMVSPSKVVVCANCQSLNRVPSNRLEDDPKCGKCKQPLFGRRPIALTDETFDKHLSRGELPLVVDFWAPWCGPCKMMAPFFEQAASKLEPRVRLAKVNTDENRALAMRYQINSIPTTAVFRGGREVARQPGAMNLPQLLQWIESKI